jgi:hypothetical protein
LLSQRVARVGLEAEPPLIVLRVQDRQKVWASFMSAPVVILAIVVIALILMWSAREI